MLPSLWAGAGSPRAHLWSLAVSPSDQNSALGWCQLGPLGARRARRHEAPRVSAPTHLDRERVGRHVGSTQSLSSEASQALCSSA
ncbi:hypothetical protein ACFPRL_05840 [Pseudoclavibacter helvolus]